MIKRIYITVFICSSLFGCAGGQIKGQFESGSPTFEGHASAEGIDTGKINLTLEDGRTCTGVFVYSYHDIADGQISCSDGQAGTLNWRGSLGQGQLNGRKFIFTIK